MITVLEFAGIALGLLSVLLSWYFGTRNRRLKKKLADLQGRLKKVEDYAAQTGYKNILRDCFSVFSYVGGLVLLTTGVKTLISFAGFDANFARYFDFFASGIYLGAGVMLFELFIMLGRVSNSSESISSIKKKIESLQSEVD